MNSKDLNKLLLHEYNFQDLFNKDLIPKKGNDIIYCIMPLEEIRIVLGAFEPIKHYITRAEWFCYIIILGNSIEIRLNINIKSSTVYVDEINFYGDYKGTYKGIGIGSTIQELLRVREDIYFDEQYVMVGKFPYDFIMRIDNDNSTIYDLNKILNNKIIEITVEDKSHFNV